MKNFIYYVVDRNGKKRVGFSDEYEKEDVLKKLKENKFFVIKILKINIFKKEISKKYLLDFFIKLEFFVKNGYQFYKIIEFLEEDEKFYYYIQKIKLSIRNGEKLSEIFKNSGLPLKEMDLAILRASEETGSVYESFKGIAERLKEKLDREKKIGKIMIYPKIVSSVILILLFFLGKFILPNFVEIIGMENTALVTKSIIFFSENILWVFFIFAFFYGIIKFLLKKQEFRKILFRIFLKIDFIRKIIENNFILYFSQMINIFLESGITVSNGIEIIRNSISNEFFREKLDITKELLKNGEDIYTSIKEMKIFNKGELELIKTGEETGELSEMFRLIFIRRKETQEYKIDRYIKFLEPLTIIIIGLFVGVIFIGVYSPILNMMSSI
ncbi:MAG: type II secretion system F family protein [Fusobacterium sp.]|uniref:type II secretion system F family protein n=1 Tax=Fusobacterium sp. TaxID=68766 RepID=UPI002A7656AA|nr:type II secretion system F family protein [Fusobacterium sp.]MDY2981348.1 type II secretion system F family protein [Fusobacterium sp.]